MRDVILKGALAIDAELQAAFNAQDRDAYVNASEIGGCIRQQWYKRHRPDAAEAEDRTLDMAGYNARGTAAETWVAACLRETGYVAEAEGDQQRIIDTEAAIAGTPDGFYASKADADGGGTWAWTVYEVKCGHYHAPWVDRMHRMQIETNLHLATIHDPDPIAPEAKLLRLSTGPWTDIEEVTVTYRASRWKSLKRRSHRIRTVTNPLRIEREGRTTGQCDYCAFKMLCDTEPMERTPSRLRGSNRIGPLVDQILDLKAAVAEEKALKAKLKEELQADGLDYVESPTGKGQAVLRTQKGRESFDRKAAIEDGLDLSPYTRVGPPVPTLYVKETK